MSSRNYFCNNFAFLQMTYLTRNLNLAFILKCWVCNRTVELIELFALIHMIYYNVLWSRWNRITSKIIYFRRDSEGTSYLENTNASQQNGFQGFNPPVHLITTTMSYAYNKTYLGEIDMWELWNYLFPKVFLCFLSMQMLFILVSKMNDDRIIHFQGFWSN